MNKTLPSLNDISYKLYENINMNDTINNIKQMQLKNLITDYFKNMETKEILNSEKNIFYTEKFKNKRMIQDELYEQYVSDRYIIYEKWLNDKSIFNIHSLSSFQKFEFEPIPDIYTYNFEINNNFGLNKSDEPRVKKDDLSEIEEDSDTDSKCTPKKIEECRKKDKICNPTTGRCIKPKTLLPIPVVNTKKEDFFEIEEVEEEKQDEKQDVKEEVKQEVNNCTPKKIEECKKKDKVCNPKSGRCIKPGTLPPPVVNTKKEDFSEIEEVKEEVKQEVKQNVKEEVKQEVNNCTPKKIEECKKKDKVCNPKSGRCIKK